MGINNTSTPTPVASHAGPTPYVGPSTVGPSSGLVYPPGFPQPANYTYTAATLRPNNPIPTVYFMPPAQPTGLLSLVQPAPPAQQVNLAQSTVPSGQATILPHAFTAGTLHDPATGTWNMDTGASSHLNNSVNSLSENFNTCMYPSISVGDGHSIPVTNTGHSILQSPTKSLHLNNVLIIPHIVKNLIYVRQFVRDNNCTIEFDAFGFSVKDFLTRRVLFRCDNTGDLYPVTSPSPIPHAFLVSQHTWHQCLGHPGGEVLRRLVSSNFISYNKDKPTVMCHACQLGKHVRLPFVNSSTMISSCFDIIHSDVWTSPIPSLSVPRPPDTNIVRCMWIFRHMYMADGTLSRYKAPLIANGSTQFEGVDVDETFRLVVKPSTIRTVFSLAASRHWPIHQLDVKNDFLHGDLSESVYMHQPPGFWDSVHPGYVCLLQRSLYGLKQPSELGFSALHLILLGLVFSHSRYDSSLFIYRQGTDIAYLLLYVDDIVLTTSSKSLLQQIIRSLHQEFAMTDLGPLSYFPGISVTRDSSGSFLSQRKYDFEILDRAHMDNCNPSRTHIDTESKLGSDGDPVSDSTMYRSLAGSLQYLTFTHLDISYAVQQVCLHMHDPREPYFSALKRILRYIRSTLDFGLQLFSSSTTDLVAY
ncbi:ribonuclease H-like domain-containing protein, partial [Tanacetum coccineum]